MTNQEWLCGLSAEDFLCHIKWLLQNYGKRWTDSDPAIIEWLQGKHEVNTPEDKGMTKEEAIKILQGAIKKPNTKDGYLGQAIDMAIKALEQVSQEKSTISQGFSQGEPCEDAVSRTEAIDKLTKFYNLVLDDNGTKLNIRDIVGTLERLPSVTPTPKKGEWIEEPSIGCKCSECGRKPYPYQADSSGDDYWKPDYCPNCGVEMESEDEE